MPEKRSRREVFKSIFLGITGLSSRLNNHNFLRNFELSVLHIPEETMERCVKNVAVILGDDKPEFLDNSNIGLAYIGLLRATIEFREVGNLSPLATGLVDDMITRRVAEEKKLKSLFDPDEFSDVTVGNGTRNMFAMFYGFRAKDGPAVIEKYWRIIGRRGRETMKSLFDIAARNLNPNSVDLYFPDIDPRYIFDERDTQLAKLYQDNFRTKPMLSGYSLFEVVFRKEPRWGILGYSLPFATRYASEVLENYPDFSNPVTAGIMTAR